MKIARSLFCLTAGVLLASCAAHGQQPPREFLRTVPPELSGLPYWKAFRNHSSHSERFFRNLVFGRVFVHEHSAAPGIASAEFVRDDGRVFRCFRKNDNGKYALSWAKLDIETHSTGAARTITYQGQIYRYLLFYEPRLGKLRVESLVAHENPHKRKFETRLSGWVQDSWPRVLADACPDFATLSGMRINEKQTSPKIDELRRQDPDAPILNFPGSHLTAPGRTGLASSGVKPTTTANEVNAFLAAQEGNIVKWVSAGYTYVRNGDREEFWRKGGWNLPDKYYDVTRSADGKWLTIGEITYPMGYPFPYLPTGHRHPAFQLTDQFLARPFPRSLPHMGEAYADKRFAFHSEGKFSVVDRNGDLVEGPHFDGVWRWTKGHLEMTVRDDPAGPRSVGWRELVIDLDFEPTVWTQSTPDRID